MSNLCQKNHRKAVKLIENLISCLSEFDPDVRASCLKLLFTLFQNFQWRRSIFENFYHESGENVAQDLTGYGPLSSRSLVNVFSRHLRDAESCVRQVSQYGYRDLLH